MSISFPPTGTVGLLLLTAVGYAVATVGMKQLTVGPGISALFLILFGLGLAVVMEVALLRQGNLSLVYLGILVAESAMVLLYAYSIGHGLTLSQMAGAGFVLLGIVLLGAHA